ncbi:molybdopterin-dependent oxidoreductase [Alcaligenaceae bacterium]|nr:molybdopterin-dependent oxidoreductase [Alcaligenaceae bacterium]
MSQHIHGYCTLCRSRCGTINTVLNDALVRVEPDTSHPTGQAMCTKGRAAPELVHSPHRILHPMRRTRPKGAADPGWKRISWDEALSEIAARFLKIREESGAESVAFGVTTPSGTPLSDSIDWIERFVRSFGSPNIAYGTEVCNWHKDFAHVFTYGCGIPVADYSNADLILLWGHNPTNTWLAQANAIAAGRRAGARLLVVDPRRTALAADADAWLQVRPGTDAALAMGLVNLLLQSGRYNHDFIRSWTNAPLLLRCDTGRLLRASEVFPDDPSDDAWVVWDDRKGHAARLDTRVAPQAQLLESCALRGEFTVMVQGGPIRCVPVFERLVQRCSDYSPERVAAITGVPEAALRSAADLFAQSKAVAYHAWSGVAQSVNATQTERAIAILYALTGSFDVPGGNRLYPRLPTLAVNGLDLIPATQRAKALGLKEKPLGPPAMGWVTARDLYQAILTGRPYRVRAYMGFGTNQLSSQGDTRMAQAAFERLEFHVHCDLFDTPSARYADIFLPVNTPWEREGLRIGFEISKEAQEHVQLRPRMVTPRGESRSDNDIVFDLACRLGMGDNFFNGSLERAWNHQLSPSGITVADLRRADNHTLNPHLTHRDKKYSLPVHGTEQPTQPPTAAGFDTETRRVELYSEQLLRHGYDPLPQHRENRLIDAGGRHSAYPYTLTSRKSGYYCHSQHRSAASLRKRSPVPEAIISGQLAADLGIEDGDWMRIDTPAGSARFVATLDPQLMKEVVYADYGWWQACPELGEPGYPVSGERNSNYNGLISADQEDPISGSVPMRHFPCRVAREPVQAPQGWKGWRDFHISSLTPVADGVLEIGLSPDDGGTLPDYRPGQHIAVELTPEGGPPLTRSYSLIAAARCGERHSYRIAVRLQQGVDESGAEWQGALSGHLHSRARAGAKIRIGSPAGRFILPESSPQPIVLFAGGIGITPFLSYLETLAQAGDMPEVWLHYANRNSAAKAYARRLEALRRSLPKLTVHEYYSAPLAQDQGPPAFMDSGVVSDALIEARARFYMCGPPPMMDALRAGLIARGVPAFDIFNEVFRSPVVVDPNTSGVFEVCFKKSGGRKETWTADQGSLLGFAEKLGLSLPSGCRVGQCESCAVSIVSGQVRHLHGAEPDDPDVCLTCQAIPASDLVLDA